MPVMLLALLVAVTGPPSREINRFDGQRVGYTVVQTPGVGQAKETFELRILLEELHEAPDPSFGKRRLLAGAELTVYLVSPSGKVIDARVAARDGDDGRFAVHFTPPRDGIYTAHLVGRAPEGVLIGHTVLVSVNVWPMLEGLRLDTLPKALPTPSIGDAAHGKLVCARDCERPLRELASETAEALADADVLTLIAPSASALREVDRNDLLAHVRTQLIRVRDLFPSAAAYVPERRALDSDAVARIKAMAGIPPSDEAGIVFVVYGGESPSTPARIEPADRITKRGLLPAARLGYLIYGSEGELETAVALGREPTFEVLRARQRGRDGTIRDVKLGQKNALVRRAVELANSYVSEERERAVIDEGLK